MLSEFFWLLIAIMHQIWDEMHCTMLLTFARDYLQSYAYVAKVQCKLDGNLPANLVNDRRVANVVTLKSTFCLRKSSNYSKISDYGTSRKAESKYLYVKYLLISGAYLGGGPLCHGPPLWVARIAKLHSKVSKIESWPPPPFVSWASGFQAFGWKFEWVRVKNGTDLE